MKLKFYTLLFFICSSFAFGQVGIGTNTPDNSAILEVSATDKGILFPRMTSLQRQGISNPASGLYVFDTNTNSLWYFNGTIWINTISDATLGDVKSGFQMADHSGWIKLDGRLVSSLTPIQQIVAVSLGFTTNLPDATTAYMVQDNATMGTVSGSNTVTVTQANLPNVNFTGTAASAGSHNHSVDPVAINTSDGGAHSHSGSTSTNGNHAHTSYGGVTINGYDTTTGLDNTSNGEINLTTIVNYATSAAGNHNHSLSINAAANHTHSVDIPATTSTTSASHTHDVSVASGGSGTALNISPKSLTVNMFVFLGQ